MPSERVQRKIDQLLEEAEKAIDVADWALVRDRSQQVLALDPGSADAPEYLAAAERALRTAGAQDPPTGAPDAAHGTASPGPTSFASGRYVVRKFLGEGGKKKVYLAHDTLLDRDVAFALIKTEGLDDAGRDRITREAQAMGRLGSHPHIVSVFDLGEEPALEDAAVGAGFEPARPTQPYIVTELMGGGDVEGLIEKEPEHRPPLERTLEIGIQVCRGLEFAHAHGIVHRDLKPGNVWLTSNEQRATSNEGPPVAKLGDFGLAVALDRSRLTQAGMMVGTVSYMPPEQAMGGEVTPRSDLYSLGAMLYEMVTGRPPFVGDESVAIITQHLNTAPVSPSWHNASIPAGLETLILRLLEKDATRRPASAAEVRVALEAIQATVLHPSLPQGERGDGRSLSPAGEGQGEGDSRAPADAQASPANPMYRRAFVGREPELRQLQTVYDAAVSGRGGLAMVVGEPGIGKTSLCEQVATYATIRGGKTLIGHCYEEGSLSLPYLPFVEALRSYVLARDPAGLRDELGTGAGEVARIVSEVRDRLQVDLPSPSAPEDDRWRLLQAVTSFLRNAAAVQPLLIVLEDLHDADRGTLDLLVHLSRNLEGSRLLIAGTYRDVEVDRSHPLSGALAELRRGQNFLRVPLRGLTAEEVRRMMASVSQRDIPWPLAELVHRQTEGNPLFVQEMLRFLVEEGLVSEQGGSLRRVGDDTLAGRIPEGLRDVIGKRLSRLASKTNQVLSIAAVIGREFRLDVLQNVAGLPEDEIEQALEQAAGAAVVEQRQAMGTLGFRFTHAFFRQTLYEEIFVPRRIRLHQQVARALVAAYGRRVEEHAAELAEHFAQTTDREDLEQALHYSRVAAERAMSVFAYAEAVRHLEQALKVQEVLDPDDAGGRCELLLALGEALLPAGEPQRAAEEVAPLALELAEGLQDGARASRSCQLALAGFTRFGGATLERSPEFGRWAAAAEQYAEAGSLEQIHANLALALHQIQTGHRSAGAALNQEALASARRLGDQEALFRAAQRLLQFNRDGRQEGLNLAEEFTRRPRDGVRALTLGQLLWFSGLVYLDFGDRERAEALNEEVHRLGVRTREPGLLWRRHVVDIMLATIDGRLEDALASAETLVARGEELGMAVLARNQSGIATRARLRLGRFEEALLGAPGNPGFRETLGALTLALGGQREAARSALRALTPGFLAADGSADRIDRLVGLEAATEAEDRETVGRLREPLSELASLSNFGFSLVCPARLLGVAAALLGDRDQALAYYAQALEAAAKIGFRPEIALTHLGIAELLLTGAGGSPAPPEAKPEAVEHLDFAIAEFREMKMQPSLERALRHKEVLRA